GWTGVIVISTAKRQEGCAEDFDVVRMRSRDHLLIGCDHATHQTLVVRGRGILIAGQHTDVVDALEDYQITNAGLRNHVMIEAPESIGSKTIEQKAVAADAVIQNGKRLCCTSRLQALCQEIGPAIVCVGGCAVAISDGVTQNNNRASSGGSG